MVALGLRLKLQLMKEFQCLKALVGDTLLLMGGLFDIFTLILRCPLSLTQVVLVNDVSSFVGLLAVQALKPSEFQRNLFLFSYQA